MDDLWSAGGLEAHHAGDMLDRMDTDRTPADIGLPTVEREAAYARVLARMRGAEQPDPVHFGRYEFVGRLGTGGMGIVYLVCDPDLERLVALKILHPELELDKDVDTDADQGRIRHEARAMARLDHPNVVRVLEVGEHEGRTFLAMEYVEGTTLAHWLRAEVSRAWREIVRVFLAAGEGLAAAHEAGMAHCDFKPDNVLIGTNGAIKVSDFGLVRGQDSELGQTIPGEGTEQPPAASGMCGTPAFMAPEQFRGSRGDARSDQFSFCVALYTALYGVAPFRGASEDELRRAVFAGRTSAARVKRRGVPAAIHRALVRGLAVQPSERWPSMAALLDELRRALGARARNRRRLTLGLGLLVSAGIVGVVTAKSLEQPDSPSVCKGAAAQLESVWSEARADQLTARVAAFGDPSAAQTWAHQRVRLDAYASAWIGSHTDACEATRVRGDQSEDEMALRMACLRRARDELDAAVGLLEQADPEQLEHAHEVISDLPVLSRCDDLEALRATIPPPDPAIAVEVEAQAKAVAEARMLVEAGRFEDGLAAARAAEVTGRELGYEPAMTAVLLVLARAQQELGNTSEALELAKRAQRAALTWGQWREAVQATAAIVFYVGSLDSASGEALALANAGLGLIAQARSAIDEAGLRDSIAAALVGGAKFDEAVREYEASLSLRRETLPADDPLIADSLDNLAVAVTMAGDPERGVELHEQGLQLRREALGPRHPLVARSLTNLGTALTDLGRFEQAESLQREALALVVELRGPEHRDTLKVRNSLARLLARLHRLDEAEAEFAALVEISSRQKGPEHVDTAIVRMNLATVLQMRHAYDEAEVQMRAVLSTFEQTLGPEHTNTITTRSNLASILQHQGRFEEADAEHRAVIAGYRAALGPDHHQVARALNNHSSTLIALGRKREAETALRSALNIGRAALGDDHPKVALTRQLLGELLLDMGQSTEARELLEAAWQVRRDSKVAHERANTAFALARALWPDPTEHARARSLAEAARDDYSEAEGYEVELEKVEDFLAKHVEGPRARR